VAGMPRFSPGEEFVLFLEKTAHGYTPTGLQQAVVRVQTDASGERTVRRDLRGMAFAAFDHAGRFSMVDAPDTLVDYPLDALLAEIRLYLDTPQAP